LPRLAQSLLFQGLQKLPRRQGARNPMGQMADQRVSVAVRSVAVVRARAVLAIALIPLAPFGDATKADVARVRRVLGAAPLLADVAPFALDELIPLTLRALAVRGPDRVLADLRGLIPPGLAEGALALAIQAAYEAGRVPERAMGILGGLANRLGVPITVFAEMLETIAMEERLPAKARPGRPCG